jgi:uncharacterized protein YlbG (UPF0298 family)
MKKLYNLLLLLSIASCKNDVKTAAVKGIESNGSLAHKEVSYFSKLKLYVDNHTATEAVKHINKNIYTKRVGINKFDQLKKVFKGNSLEKESLNFLLYNMLFHNFNYGDKEYSYGMIINNFAGQKDLLLGKLDSMNLVRYGYSKTLNDSNYVSPEYLIKNLNLAYQIFNNTSWKDSVSHNIFNNYVLPYKYTSSPAAIFDWRQSVLDKYLSENDSSIFQKGIKGAASQVYSWFKKRKFEVRLTNGYNFPQLSAHSVLKLPIGSCHELSTIGVLNLRALGIPAAIDKTPNYLNVNGGHEWCSAILDAKHCVPFDLSSPYFEVFKKPERKLSKVFRQAFMPILGNHYNQRGYVSQLPSFLNDPFLEDVTANYCKTQNVILPIENSERIISKFVYISVFNYPEWKIVDWGTVRNGKAYYHELAVDGIYLPVDISQDGSIKAISKAFLLDKSGNIQHFNPDVIHPISVNLLRKHPDFFRHGKMKGGKFQAANKDDFSDAIDLFTIDNFSNDHFEHIKIGNDSKFRYYRYLSPNSSHGNIAEIEFIKSGKLLNGHVIGTVGSFNNLKNNTKEAAFDKNPLTFFDSKVEDVSNCWVGIDLGYKESISGIRYLARTDLNGVYPGNEYELFYWDSKWISLGTNYINSDQNALVYNNVPMNSVLWLRNKTSGKEERIFTYENGKQLWW